MSGACSRREERAGHTTCALAPTLSSRRSPQSNCDHRQCAARAALEDREPDAMSGPGGYPGAQAPPYPYQQQQQQPGEGCGFAAPLAAPVRGTSALIRAIALPAGARPPGPPQPGFQPQQPGFRPAGPPPGGPPGAPRPAGEAWGGVRRCPDRCNVRGSNAGCPPFDAAGGAAAAAGYGPPGTGPANGFPGAPPAAKPAQPMGAPMPGGMMPGGPGAGVCGSGRIGSKRNDCCGGWRGFLSHSLHRPACVQVSLARHSQAAWRRSSLLARPACGHLGCRRCLERRSLRRGRALARRSRSSPRMARRRRSSRG